MAWIYLFIAGAIEIGWAVGLKHTNGLTKDGVAIVATVAGMILSYVFLALAMRTLPLSISYPVWTGIGAVGTAIFGMAFMNEPADKARILCVTLIVVGVIGLKWLHG